jgi:WD40 repeat protein
VARFDGHEEEILSIKHVVYKGDNYFVSTSQDGYIIQHKVDQDWTNVLERERMKDGITCMAFNVSFLPNTGNRFFVASCDDSIRLFDMETKQVFFKTSTQKHVQTFPGMYSYYCDCVKCITCIDLIQPPNWETVFNTDEVMFSYIMSRGVEVLDAENNTINSKPNSVTLHKLIYPKTQGQDFKLEQVKRFCHDSYHSNSWLMKITSNGRYIAAPTFNGNVYLYNIQSGELAGVLRDHEEIEVRDVLFHSTMPLFFSCADGNVD